MLDAVAPRIIEMKKPTPFHLMCAEYGQQNVDKVQTNG
jgi:hypothetical protein